MKSVLLACLLFVSGTSHSTEPPKQERSVLFIGNSMIGRTMHHLSMISQAEEHPWKITPVTKGGARLESFKGDTKHDAFGTIDKGGFTDVVFVQGTSYWFEGTIGDAVNIKLSQAERPKIAEKTLAAAQEMHEHIAAIGARTVLYMGYPHMPAHERTPAAYAPLEAIHWAMKDRLDALKKGETLLVPNGPLWIRGAEHFGEAVWYANDRHGKDIAYYANAVLFHACMSGKDPREIGYDGGLDPVQSKWIKEQAWDLSKNYRRPADNSAH